MGRYLIVIATSLVLVHCEQSACIEPLIFGHRGTVSRAPENTMAAFLHAVEQGADGVEIDVRMTADQRLIAFHDKRTWRTTNHTEPEFIGDMTLEEIKDLDAGSWFNEEYQGEEIPTLYEIIDILPLKTQVMLDLKSPSSIDRVMEFIDYLSDDYNLQERLIIASFNENIVARFRAEFPNIRRALFVKTLEQLKTALRLDVHYVRVPDSQDRAQHDEVREAGYVPIIGSMELDWEGAITISDTPGGAAHRKKQRRPAECGLDRPSTNAR